MVQEASFTFTTPLNVNLIEIKGVEHLFVEGDISTNDVDLVDDSMTKNCQESMQKQILERNMKLDIEHEAFKGKTHEEKEINKTKIPAGKLIDATVKDLGKDKRGKGRYATRVKGEINPHNPNYKDTKGNLLDKYLDAFSVAFLPVEIKYEERDGKKIRLLEDVILLNVALTGNPCNTKAQLTEIITKSMDAVEQYKRMKEIDPDLEKSLIVKTKNTKENPLSYIWNRIMSGNVLEKNEIKLLKAAIDVAGNKGTSAQLVKELFDKVANGIKLSWKEYYVFRELIEMEYPMDSEMAIAETPYKSNSTGLPGRKADLVSSNQLNKPKNFKMTEDDPKKDPVDEAAADADGKPAEGTPAEGDGEPEAGGNGSGDAETQKMFKSVSETMKALADKYDVVQKDNVTMKEDMKVISESLAKITEALANPIHKSPGVQINDAEAKAKAGVIGKSVDPLSLF